MLELHWPILNDVPESCPKCAGSDFRGPMYSDRYERLDYCCVRCGYQFATPTVEAWDRAQAATIEEREELVEALSWLVRNYVEDVRRDEWDEHDAKVFDLLVKHGRVIRDGSVYRWKTKGG